MAELLKLGDAIEDFDGCSIADLVEEAAAHVRVEHDGAMSKTDIAALEKELGVTLPGSHRGILLEFGGVTFRGDEDYGFGTMRICGATDLAKTREWLRTECHDWAGDEAAARGWLDHEVPWKDAPNRGTVAEQRARVAKQLDVDAALLDPFFGDLYDKLRFIHRHLVPLFVEGEVIHQGVTCVGPNGRLYRADIKGWDVELARQDFAVLACEALRDLVVRGD